MTEPQKKAKHGKKPKQRMKPYIVHQYLLEKPMEVISIRTKSCYLVDTFLFSDI